MPDDPDRSAMLGDNPVVRVRERGGHTPERGESRSWTLSGRL